MKKGVLLLVILFVVNFVVADEVIPGKLIVQVKDLDDVAKLDNFRPVFNIDYGNYELKKELGMDRVFEINFDENLDVFELAEDYDKMSFIEYAEPVYRGKVLEVPNDPRYPAWHHEQPSDHDLDSESAWDIETGSEDVIIAIIDTGTEYNHEDLVENMWQNLGEDMDGDGVLYYDEGDDEWYFDPDDINGIDDDGNGFVDDFVGWDFIDYDNNVKGVPYVYENHGTKTAGTAAARTNNSEGVAAVCWYCTVMPIRAHGHDNETDLPRSIEYAVDNGADILSISLGVPPTRTLHMVVRYAYLMDIPQVAAAGNEGAFFKLWPAGYPEVIAVGATDLNDERVAGLWGSNYGSWVDVAAPGVCIKTLNVNDTYIDHASGTSMSTPLVSGVIGLIKSKHPEFNHDQILTVVHTATDPVYSDYYFGTGRINAHEAVLYDNVPVAKLDSSLDDLKTYGDFFIIGSAYGDGFRSYTVEYGFSPYPSEWNFLAGSRIPVVDGELARFDVSDINESGYHTIRLTVKDNENNKFIDMINVYVYKLSLSLIG